MPACLQQGTTLSYPVYQLVMPHMPGALKRTLQAPSSKNGWPQALAREFAQLALSCMAAEVSTRPSMAHIVCRLQWWQHEYCQGLLKPLGREAKRPTNGNICSQRPPTVQFAKALAPPSVGCYLECDPELRCHFRNMRDSQSEVVDSSGSDI